MAEGRCLCGALRYEADPPFQFMVNCHCSMCRKHHGSAFATFIAVPPAAFRWVSGEANVGVYQSSENAARAFCRVCGSVAPHLLPSVGQIIIPAGNLDGDLGVTPQLHIFAGSRAPWYEITDTLPRSEEYPPGFDAMAVDRPRVTATRRSRGGQLPVRRRRVRDPRHAAVHEELPLLALPARTRRRARHQSVLSGRMRSAGYAAKRRWSTSRCPRRVTSALRSVGAAAARCRAFRPHEVSSSCRRGRSTSTQASGRPSTSSRARRPCGSKSPTVSRNTTTMPPPVIAPGSRLVPRHR